MSSTLSPLSLSVHARAQFDICGETNDIGCVTANVSTNHNIFVLKMHGVVAVHRMPLSIVCHSHQQHTLIIIRRKGVTVCAFIYIYLFVIFPIFDSSIFILP